ncbi:hypothetical protein [Avibacterium avium]|uniref:hypothetical protein n=1 Tax=Avibacterium avium TaxID=751 RepID=UPI003BF7BE2B
MKIVKTKEEFDHLVKANEKEFIVVGKLAEKLQRTKKLATMGKISLGIIATALAAAPFTGGTSTLMAVPTVGVSTAAWGAILFFGIILISFYKNYDLEVVGEMKDAMGNVYKGSVKCTKRK